PNGTFSRVVGGQSGLLTGNQLTGVSGRTPAFNTDHKDFAPSFGLAWSPNFHFGDKGASGILKHIFGESGQTVIRGGYAIAYDREGANNFYSIWGSNPGPFLSPTESFTNGLLPTTAAAGGGLLLTSTVGGATPLTSPVSFLVNFKPLVFPLTVGLNANGTSTGAFLTSSMNDFAPNLRVGYVQSWSFGIQRELNKDTALEIRYVANHGTDLWRQYNLNELQGISNGFINEFNAAVTNLKNCGGGSFAPGCGGNALPTFTGTFGSATSSLYTNSSFISALSTGQLGTVVSLLNTGLSTFPA